MSAIQEENTVMNAQGEFIKPDFSDPIAIKMDSAKKMSLADKTGNEALKREAAAEQSFADRMGGRSALSKKKQQAGEPAEAPVVDSPRTIGMLKSASQPVLAGSKQQQGMMKSQSSMKVAFPQAVDTTGISKEALALKLDAAAKQSLADRTGDARLKAAAAAEQSLADKLGSTASSRLDLSAFKRPDSGEFSSSAPSETSSSLPQPKLIPLANIDSDGNIVLPPTLSAPVSPTPSHHVPLPLPSNSSSSTSILMHTCSCCGHTEPFNGGRSQPKRREEKREDSKREEKKVGADADKWVRGQKIPSREELIQKGKSPYQNQTQDKKEGHKRNGSNNGNGGNGNLSRPDPVSPRADLAAPVSPQSRSPKSGQRSRPESPANLKVEAMPFLPQQQQKSMIPSPSESSITPASQGNEMVRSASAGEINTILIGEGNSAQQLQLRPRRVNNNNRRNKAIKREQAAKEGEENAIDEPAMTETTKM